MNRTTPKATKATTPSSYDAKKQEARDAAFQIMYKFVELVSDTTLDLTEDLTESFTADAIDDLFSESVERPPLARESHTETFGLLLPLLIGDGIPDNDATRAMVETGLMIARVLAKSHVFMNGASAASALKLAAIAAHRNTRPAPTIGEVIADAMLTPEEQAEAEERDLARIALADEVWRTTGIPPQ